MGGRKKRKTNVPKRYVPKQLSKKDKKKQARELKKSRRAYKKGKYHTRKKMKSFKSKVSPHIIKARKMYKVDKIRPTRKLAKATKCKLKGLKRMFKKGQGAYFSSGSRPNQTGHSWGYARMASAITGGKASAVDFKIIEENCSKKSRAYKLAKKAYKKYKKGRRRVKQVKIGGAPGDKKNKNKTKKKKPNIKKKEVEVRKLKPQSNNYDWKDYFRSSQHDVIMEAAKKLEEQKAKEEEYDGLDGELTHTPTGINPVVEDVEERIKEGRTDNLIDEGDIGKMHTQWDKDGNFIPPGWKRTALFDNYQGPPTPFNLGRVNQKKLKSQQNFKPNKEDAQQSAFFNTKIGGQRMKETIVKFKRGPYPKKYTAIVKNKKNKKTRKIHFGDRRYQQYKDRTPLKLYKSKNHNTRKRMQNYFSRHSGTKKRGKAIKKEKNKSNGLYNAKILSHVYLW